MLDCQSIVMEQIIGVQSFPVNYMQHLRNQILHYFSPHRFRKISLSFLCSENSYSNSCSVIESQQIFKTKLRGIYVYPMHNHAIELRGARIGKGALKVEHRKLSHFQFSFQTQFLQIWLQILCHYLQATLQDFQIMLFVQKKKSAKISSNNQKK